MKHSYTEESLKIAPKIFVRCCDTSFCVRFAVQKKLKCQLEGYHNFTSQQRRRADPGRGSEHAKSDGSRKSEERRDNALARLPSVYHGGR